MRGTIGPGEFKNPRISKHGHAHFSCISIVVPETWHSDCWTRQSFCYLFTAFTYLLIYSHRFWIKQKKFGSDVQLCRIPNISLSYTDRSDDPWWSLKMTADQVHPTPLRATRGRTADDQYTLLARNVVETRINEKTIHFCPSITQLNFLQATFTHD